MAIDLLKFMWEAWKCWKKCGARGTSYGSVTATRGGIPETVIFIARGREAWRVSQLAIMAKTRLEG